MAVLQDYCTACRPLCQHILNTLFSPCYVTHSLVGMGSVYLWRTNQVFMRARCHVANNVSH